MTGILCIDKPEGFTSFDVVAKLRGITKTKKIGHGGTLDPMATGVLPVFLGRAAKACDLLPDQDKTYVAAMRLGLTTDTQDRTGTVLTSGAPLPGAKAVREAAASFAGKHLQLPPMYSAVKVGGVRLYDLARRGVEVERAPREVCFHSLALLREDEANGIYEIEVSCSKGAYIRTLCHDIGQKLGCGAVLESLRRTRACGFGIEQCVTLRQAEELMRQGALEERVLPVETAFSGLPRAGLSAGQARRFQNGVRLPLGELSLTGTGRVTVWSDAGVFLGIAEASPEEGLLRMIRLFTLAEN